MKPIHVLFCKAILSLLILVVALLSSANAQDERKFEMVGVTPDEAKNNVKVRLWAVVIGISLYKQGETPVDEKRIKNLKYADDDALAMYNFLLSRQGGSFPKSNIKLLLDKEATKKNVDDALEWLADQAEPQDYFVIYIAAHGAIGPSDTDAGGKAPYFILHDTDLGDVPNTAIDMRVFREKVANRDLPDKGLVICDTCHSSGVYVESERGIPININLSIPANKEFIERIKDIPKGVGFLLAAGVDEGSKELDELQHGVFTWCLLEGLRGAADHNTDGIVNFSEASKYLTNGVQKLNPNQQAQAIPNSISATLLPLSIVSYADVRRDDLATLVIRSPDVDEVEVKVDGKTTETLRAGIETTIMVKPEPHELEFTWKGSSAGRLRVEPELGRFEEIVVKFSFPSDDLPRRTGLPMSFNLPEKNLSDKAQKLYYEGLESFHQQRFQEAIKKLDAAIQENNSSYQPALVFRGRALQSLGRHDEAAESFDRALKLKPSDYETETLLAEAMFYASGSVNVNNVLKRLKDISRRYPEYFYTRVVLGDVLLSRGEVHDAEMELRQSLRLYPDSPASHMILANILSHFLDKSKRIEAIEHAKKALTLLEELSTKIKTFKRASLLHLIFGGAQYVDRGLLAEVHYILAKSYIQAVLFNQTTPDRAAYLQGASKHLLEAKTLAQKNSLKQRLALALALSTQYHLLMADTTSAIKDGEEALKISGPQPRLDLLCNLHFMLSQAYESNQRVASNKFKAVEHQQKYIDIGCEPGQREKPLQRLEMLKARIADQKR